MKDLLTPTFRFGIAFISVCLSQGIALLSGIISIRMLPVAEYGLYTLGMSVTQLGLILSDLGLSGAVSSVIAGSENPSDALILVRRELVRYRIVLCGIWISFAAIGYPYYSKWIPEGAKAVLGPLQVGLISATFVALLWFHSHVALFRGAAPMSTVARMDIGTAIVRCIFTIGSVLIVPTAESGLAGLLLSYMVAGGVVHWAISRIQVTNTAPDSEVVFWQVRRLKEVFGPVVLPSLFFAIQSYAVTYLTLQRGSITDLAVVSAVTRFGQVYAILGGVNTSLVQPFLARQVSWAKLKLAVLAVLGLAVCVAVSVVGLATLSSPFLVTILGDQYREHASLIPLGLTGPSIYFIGTSIYGVLLSRGQTGGQWLTIPFGLAGIVAGLYLIPFGVPGDFLIFEIVRCSTFFLCQIVLLGIWLNQVRRLD